MPLLEIDNLRLEFGATRVVDGVSLSLESGRTLCLVGESGSGKSVTALSVARLLPSPPARYRGGEIRLDGRDVLRMSPAELQRIRGGVVSYIFQEPGASLNPVLRVGAQINESLRQHRPASAGKEEIVRLLGQVGIPAPELRMRQYPHEMSGGMQQRVMIAMALASRPRLLIADEPTTALDVTIQADILDLLRELRGEFGMAVLLITHNLAIVGDFADTVAVMYAGQIVECGPAREILQAPRHPYTRALLRAVPDLALDTDRLATIPGNVPTPGNYPAGCRFHPRCPVAERSCRELEPGLDGDETHQVRCPFWRKVPPA